MKLIVRVRDWLKSDQAKWDDSKRYEAETRAMRAVLKELKETTNGT